MYDEPDEDYYLTPEEQTAKHLRDNPVLECGLWTEWVGVVCGWEKIASPNGEEWSKLRANYYSGKAPIDSVAELKRMRINEPRTGTTEVQNTD
jgi:hypothetical protein